MRSRTNKKTAEEDPNVIGMIIFRFFSYSVCLLLGTLTCPFSSFVIADDGVKELRSLVEQLKRFDKLVIVKTKLYLQR